MTQQVNSSEEATFHDIEKVLNVQMSMGAIVTWTL